MNRAGMPDRTAPDLTAPDFTAPDPAAPDFAAPDFATPGLAAPDLAGPDLAAMQSAAALIALVRQIRDTGVNRHALILRLSSLPDVRPHHRRLAHEALEPLTEADRAQLFTLPNGDPVVVWRGMASALAACRQAIATLFADDEDGALDPATLIDLFDLPADTQHLLRAAGVAPKLWTAPAPVRKPRRPLEPRTLAGLETALAQASLARFARRMPVCHRRGRDYRLVWEHRLLDIEELFATMAPDHAPDGAPWLFRRLRQTLDRRLLALLGAAGELNDAGPFGLDLHVAGVVGPEFLRFDANLPSDLRGRVVLGLPAPDIAADPASFLFARDFARGRGYRLALSGVAAAQRGMFAPTQLGVDLIELIWSPELAGTRLDLDPACVVLSGVDDARAVSWAQGAGIALCRGRLAMPETWTRAPPVAEMPSTGAGDRWV